MNSGNDEESELDTKRNKVAGMEEKKRSPEVLSVKASLRPLDGWLHHRALYHKSIAAGPRGTLPRGKKNRHGTSRQINVRVGQSLWNSQDPSPAGLLRPPLHRGPTLSQQSSRLVPALKEHAVFALCLLHSGCATSASRGRPGF